MNDALMQGFVAELTEMEKGAAFGKALLGVGKLVGRAITGKSPAKKTILGGRSIRKPPLGRRELAQQAVAGAKGMAKKYPGQTAATVGGAGLAGGYLASR